MFGIGMPEMILILAVALIVIGPKKLPDLARSLGRALGEFKKATRDLKESMDFDRNLDEVKTSFRNIDSDLKPPLHEPAAPDLPKGQEADGESREPAAAAPDDKQDDLDSLKQAFDHMNAPENAPDADGSPALDPPARNVQDRDSDHSK